MRLLPYLFSSYAVLHHLTMNLGKLALTPWQLQSTAEMLIAVNLLTWLVHRNFMKFTTKNKAILFTFGFSLLFFNFGAFEAMAPVRYRILLAVWVMSVVLWGFLVYHFPEPPKHFLKMLTLGVVGLYLIFPIPKIAQEISQRQNFPETHYSFGNQKHRPDIYYLVFDSYASPQALKKFHGYSNKDFLSKIKRQGFTIASKATTPHPYTRDSMAAALAMTPKTQQPIDAQQHSTLLHTFESEGYETISLTSLDTAGSLKHLPTETLLKCPTLEKSQISFAQSLPLGSYLVRDLLTTTKLKNSECQFKQIETLAKTPRTKPRFLFAYLFPAHEEFALTKDGDIRNVAYRTNKYQTTQGIRDLYLEEIEYLNRNILKLTQTILKNSPNAVIVLQGDHGTRITNFSNDEELYRPTQQQIEERWSILNALHLPKHLRRKVPQNLSSTNTFRFILKEYFQSSIELHQNQHFTANGERITDHLVPRT